MLTYLDGMKWNCLAQRYLYTSTTTWDFKVIYKPTVHFKMMDLDEFLVLHYSPSVFCDSCVFLRLVHRRCKWRLALSLLLFHLVLRLHNRLFHHDNCWHFLSRSCLDGHLWKQSSFHKKQQKTASVCHHMCHKIKCYYPFQPGRNNVYMWFIIQTRKAW